MIHPDTELRFISPEIGYGVVATKRIPKGTITWAYDALDRNFTADQIRAMDPHYQDILYKYCYRDNLGRFVFCWDHSRFVNHSYRSNCISTAYNFEIAIRDIEAGEELTDDYGYLNVWEPFYAAAEPGIDRKAVFPDDLLHFHQLWDAQLLAAFPAFNDVPQPLAHLLEPALLGKARRISAGKEEMDSVLNCHYDGDKALAEDRPIPGTL